MIKQTIANIALGLVLVFSNSVAVFAQELSNVISVPSLLISEVQNNGALDNTSTQEFIELYNPSLQPLNILDWQVVYRNTSGNESILYTFTEPRLVLPGEFIIGKHLATSASYLPDITADFTYTTGSTGLAQTTGGVLLKDNSHTVIDEVRWTKAATYVNDITVLELLGGVSAQRTCNTDGTIEYSGIQINDFKVSTVTPRAIKCDEPLAEPPVDEEYTEVTPPVTQEPPANETEAPSDDVFLNATTVQLPIYINELFIDPVSPLTDAVDEYVELYNPHAEPVDVSGYTIVAGVTTKYRYTFMAGTQIAPGSYMSVTSGDTPLTLSNSGGQVVLFDALGAQIDTVEYSDATPGFSWAQNRGGIWEWTSSPTFNTANVITSPVPVQKVVVASKTTATTKKPTTTSTTNKKTNFSVALPIQLNEVYPDPKAPQTDANDEFIELYNPYPYAINITDYTLVTGTTKTYKYVLPKGSIIAANGYFVVTSADSPISLTNTSGQVRLLNNFDKQIDSTDYDKAKSGASWAKDDFGKWQWTNVVTIGVKNSIELASIASKSKDNSKTTSVAGATVAGTDDIPLAPAPQPLPNWMLALIGVSAVCYAAYEYRFEVRNYIYKFRANRTAG